MRDQPWIKIFLCIHSVTIIHIRLNLLFVEPNGRDGTWAWNPKHIPFSAATYILIKVHYKLITKAFDLKFFFYGRLKPISSKHLFILFKFLLNSKTNQFIVLFHIISFDKKPIHKLAFDSLTHN